MFLLYPNKIGGRFVLFEDRKGRQTGVEGSQSGNNIAPDAWCSLTKTDPIWRVFELMTEEQSQMFELLRIFKGLCEKNKLSYFIMGGTLLGAVRHKGFIPWDDDADVSMPLDDYKRFIALADKLPENLVIQSEDNDERYPFVFAKLCNTQHDFDTGFSNKPRGVYIDVFPLMPSKKLGRVTKLRFEVINVINYVLQVKLGWTAFVPYKRRVARWGYRLLDGLSVKRLRKIRQTQINKLCDKNSTDTICSPGGAYKADKEFYPAEWFEKTENMMFEGEQFDVPAGWDAYLSRNYGSYMELPPPEERSSNHKTKN